MKYHLLTAISVCLSLAATQVSANNIAIHREITPDRVINLDFSPASPGIETFAATDQCSLAILGDERLQFTSRASIKIKSADGASKLYEIDIRKVTSKFKDPFNPSNAGWDNLILLDVIGDGKFGIYTPSSLSINEFEEVLCDASYFNVATYPAENIFIVSQSLWVAAFASESDNSNGTNSYEEDITGFAIQAHNGTTGARLWKKSFLTGGNWLIDRSLSGVGDFLPAAGREYRVVEEFNGGSRSTYRYTYYDLNTGNLISRHTVSK